MMYLFIALGGFSIMMLISVLTQQFFWTKKSFSGQPVRWAAIEAATMAFVFMLAAFGVFLLLTLNIF